MFVCLRRSVIYTVIIFTLFLISILTSKTYATYKSKDAKKETSFKYKVKENLKPSNLDGITDEQINDHWKLYEGYVAQVNKLNKELCELDPNSLAYADRRRRYGFEYNGMILHEYYFGNLIAEKNELSDGKLKQALEETWGSYEKWLQDFINTGKTRGIGWAILYLDPKTGTLVNTFVGDHENGHISGFKPIIVMDVWEHAYMVDHKAGGRADYISAFIKNINWARAEKRFKNIMLKKHSTNPVDYEKYL